jgi:hypothetical protein
MCVNADHRVHGIGRPNVEPILADFQRGEIWHFGAGQGGVLVSGAVTIGRDFRQGVDSGIVVTGSVVQIRCTGGRIAFVQSGLHTKSELAHLLFEGVCRPGRFLRGIMVRPFRGALSRRARLETCSWEECQIRWSPLKGFSNLSQELVCVSQCACAWHSREPRV